MTSVLEISGVSIDLGSRSVLRDVSATFSPGAMTVVVGPNGAGKSTLMRALAGEISPSRGTIMWGGRALSQFSSRELASRRAVMPQAARLAFPFQVDEVVMLGCTVPGFHTDQDRTCAAEAMEMAGIEHLSERSYMELSGGERQRVHFARAMCQLLASRSAAEKTLLLLDEPTSNLDLPYQMELMRCAREEARRGRIVISVLHDLNLAATWGDAILALSNGQAAHLGTPGDVLTSSGLSSIYGSTIEVTELPGSTLPLILPQLLRSTTVLALDQRKRPS